MTPPLVYLFVATRRNAVARFVTGLRRPRKALGLLATVALFATVAWTFSHSAGTLEQARAASVPMLRAYLGFVLLMSFFSGLSERGIPFTPAEVHFLFPGPFRRRDLVLYHLAGLVPLSLTGALLPFLFFGLRAPNPALAFVGCALAGLAAQHVRLAVSLVAIHLGERLFRRLRTPVRVVLIVLTLGLVALLVDMGTGSVGMRETIARFAASDTARVVLYPAAVAGDLAEVGSVGGALVLLLGALAAVVATLVPVLLLQVNFLEESIGASERNAARRARMRRSRNLAAVTAGDQPVRAVRLPPLPVFRGAGAIAWKNLVVARRSLRSIFFSTVFLLVFFVPAMFGRGHDDVFPLAMAGLFPMFLSASIAFDFRSEGAQLATLKALPLSRTAVAAAEVAVPTAIILAFQGLYLLAIAVAGRAPVAWAGLAWLACLPVTAAMVAAANLAHMYGPKGAGASLLQMLFLVADVTALALVAWGLDAVGVGLVGLGLGLAFAQIAVVVGVVALLGLAFGARDVAEDPL